MTVFLNIVKNLPEYLAAVKGKNIFAVNILGNSENFKRTLIVG